MRQETYGRHVQERTGAICWNERKPASKHPQVRESAFPHAAARTDRTTPAVRTTRLSSSNGVGIFFSIAAPSSAVMTGMPERMIWDSDSERNTRLMLFRAMFATCAPR